MSIPVTEPVQDQSQQQQQQQEERPHAHIFVGNMSYQTRKSELEDLVTKNVGKTYSARSNSYTLSCLR